MGATAELDYLDFPPSIESTHSFVLESLDKFTSYQVVVLAYNTQGEGPISTSMVATTLEDGKR